MPRRVIVATARAAGMTVALPGCTGGPATTATSPAPVAGPAQGSPKGAGFLPICARPRQVSEGPSGRFEIGHWPAEAASARNGLARLYVQRACSTS